MKTAIQRSTLAFFAFIASIAQAAMQEGGVMAPEPQVATFWVFAFLVLFVGICIWIGVAIWRAERKKKGA